MSRHRVFAISASIPNGFDIVQVDGVTYMRVITLGRPTAAVPQTAPQLRQFAASLLNAADVLDRRKAGGNDV